MIVVAVLAIALALAGPAAAADVDGELPVHAVIVGRAGDPAVSALLAAARGAGAAGLVVDFYDLDALSRPSVPASVAAMLANARAGSAAVAYVCTEAQCSLPISDPSKLRAVIRTFPRSR